MITLEEFHWQVLLHQELCLNSSITSQNFTMKISVVSGTTDSYSLSVLPSRPQASGFKSLNSKKTWILQLLGVLSGTQPLTGSSLASIVLHCSRTFRTYNLGYPWVMLLTSATKLSIRPLTSTSLQPPSVHSCHVFLLGHFPIASR